MPWEETTDYIRSGHNDPGICQSGSMRTITISDEEGIKAVICRPHGKDTTVVQSYLFARSKGWTVSKAQEWFSKHETASARAAVRYCVRAQAIEQDGKKYALIEVIDENVSRPCESPPDTRVRINSAGKARALADVLQKPLVGPPELGHEATWIVGHPVDFTSNHATRVLFEIPDPAVWAKIESHEWGPVSPRMTPIKAHYEDDVFVLDEWRWDDFAFVPFGAFPNAGVKSTCIGDPRLCGFTAQKPCGFSYAVAAAAAQFSKSRLKAGKPRTMTDVGAYSPEKASKDPEEKTLGPLGGVTMEKCEHEKVIAQLTDKNTTLEADAKAAKAKLAEALKTNEKIAAELKELKEKPVPSPTLATPVAASDGMVAVQAELKAVKTECETLKAWKVAAEEADHMRRVQEVIDLQVGAGLVEAAKVQAAIEDLKKLPNDALEALKKTLGAVKGKFDSLPSGPKARLIPSAQAAGHFDPTQPTVGSLIGKKLGES